MEIRLIADYECSCGEGPLWHPLEKQVYWTDIPSGRLFRYDPATDVHEPCFQGDEVGGYTIQEDGSLLLFQKKGAIRNWKNGELTTLIEEIPDESDTRFNDVIADPAGRVFCGTMPTRGRSGRLYRLDTDGSLHLVLEGIDCSNGLGFTPDGRQMYYTDSPKREIYLFDYNKDTGAITNQSIFAKLTDSEGVPDGMTVDAEGYVWSGIWDGSCAIRFDPKGVEVQRVEFPARKVSCVTFGGEDYGDMYVTTAGGREKEKEGHGAGALFHWRPEVPGVPEFHSRIKIG